MAERLGLDPRIVIDNLGPPSRDVREGTIGETGGSAELTVYQRSPWPTKSDDSHWRQ